MIEPIKVMIEEHKYKKYRDMEICYLPGSDKLTLLELYEKYPYNRYIREEINTVIRIMNKENCGWWYAERSLYRKKDYDYCELAALRYSLE